MLLKHFWSIVLTCWTLPVSITFELASAHIPVKLYCTFLPLCLFLFVRPDSHDIWCHFICCGVFETYWYPPQLSPPLSFGYLQVKLAVHDPDLSLHLERTWACLLFGLYSVIYSCHIQNRTKQPDNLSGCMWLQTQQCMLILFFVCIRICHLLCLEMSLTFLESSEFSSS